MSLGKPTKVCVSCKGENVFVDASAKWDPAKGEWVLREAYPTSHAPAWCEDCNCETELIVCIPQSVQEMITISPSKLTEAEQIERYGMTESEVDAEAESSVYVVMGDDLCGHIEHLVSGGQLLILFFGGAGEVSPIGMQMLERAQYLLRAESYNQEYSHEA